MSLTLSVDVSPVLKSLSALDKALGNTTVPNRQLSAQMYSWIMNNFNAGGGMQDPPWAPLAESTLKQKAKQGYSSQPLIRTGNLRQSFAPFYTSELAGVGAKASMGVDYAQVHQEGTDHIPQRSMLPPAELVQQYAGTIYGNFVAKSIAKAGLAP